MFRRFSLFDSSPPASRISIAPPRPSKSKSQKSPLKGAIINTLQNAPATILINSHDAKRSKSLDHATNLRMIQTKQRAKSTTLPPIINKQLPQASPTSHRWYSRLGNSFRRGGWARRAPVHYQVMLNMWQLENIITLKRKQSHSQRMEFHFMLFFVLHN